MRRILSAASVFLFASFCANAQIVVTGPGQPSLQVNPAPLNIPANGLTETMLIDHNGSFIAESARIVDCPNAPDEPFGLCSNLLFGGHALMSSNLQGFVQVRFYPPSGNICHFEISFPQNLAGDDTVMAAPQLYRMPVTQNYVLNPLSSNSGGDVDINTGQVLNQNVSVLVTNSWYLALQNANPLLIAEPFSFPGPLGYSQIVFGNRSDGLIDVTIQGSTFLPLGAAIQNDPIRIPLPLCGPLASCASVVAAGTALHPTLRVSTVPLSNPPCAPNCPALPTNTDYDFTSNNYYTTLGDNFNLNIPSLGGLGPARSQLAGRVKIEFGVPNGNHLPFHVTALPPEGLLGPTIAGLPVGLSIGMVGSAEFLYFPNSTYFFNNVLTGDDPFNNAIGEIDTNTGAVVGNFIYRSYFEQSIFIGLAKLNPGVVPASLAFQGPAQFETDRNGELVFRYDGDAGVGFSGFVFPIPSLLSGYITGPGSQLDLYYRQQMVRATDPPNTVKSGSASNVVDSLGDTFSYSYSIPCSGSGGTPTFTYKNDNASGKVTDGGTFTMNSMSSVQCINSRNSTAAPGDYDTVTFSGYGSWSVDTSPHIANVQVSTNPPYVHILIDAGQTSQANTKPAVAPLP